ncbi:MAG: hypothetical protein II956_14345 [Bacteroidales bacterium]|nr:hypothetical protein [Bacteroidales bacterium]
MNVTAAYKQTLLDLALQTGGTAESAMELALINSRCLSDELEAGNEITLPDLPQNRQMVKYYSVNGILPATGLKPEFSGIVYGGINYMGIEIDFIVS